MGIPKSGNVLPVESGIWENFPCGIWNPGLWTPENNSRHPNPTTIAESGIQDPLTYRIFAIVCSLNSIMYQCDADRVLWECKLLLVLKSLFKNAGKLSW